MHQTIQELSNYYELPSILIEFCRVRGHLFRMGFASSVICWFCDNENESSEHILEPVRHSKRKHLVGQGTDVVDIEQNTEV